MTRRTIGYAVVAMLCTAIIVGAHIASDPPYPSSDVVTAAYNPPTDNLQALYAMHDGQFNAAIAMDPTLAHPNRFVRYQTSEPSRGEAAYRFVRPVIGVLGWVASAGQSGAVEGSLLAVTILTVGLLVLAAGACARSLGRDSDTPLLLIVLLAPGALAVMVYPGLGDALGTAMSLFALVLWRRRRIAPAVACLIVAALCHESYLIVAGALGVTELVERRPRIACSFAVPFAALAGWMVVVRLRVGAWPTDAGHGRLAAPLSGLFNAFRGEWVSGRFLFVLLGVAAAVAIWLRLPQLPYRAIVLGYGLFALLLGRLVWLKWEDFGRVLLPVYVLGALSLLPVARTAGASAPAGPRASEAVS